VRKKGSFIEITYRDGWKESLSTGWYSLFDAKSRLVVKRSAKQSDLTRINAARKLKKRK
jgi:hypothetical protein